MVPFAGIIWHLTYGECHNFRSSLKVLKLLSLPLNVHRSIVRSTHWTICNLLNTRSSALHANYGIVHLDLFELLSRILFWQWQSSPLKYVHILLLYMSHILQFSRFFQYFESAVMVSWVQKGSVLNIYCWWTLKKIMFHCNFFSWILVLKMRKIDKEIQSTKQLGELKKILKLQLVFRAKGWWLPAVEMRVIDSEEQLWR